jgi:hypothetical protein
MYNIIEPISNMICLLSILSTYNKYLLLLLLHLKMVYNLSVFENRKKLKISTIITYGFYLIIIIDRTICLYIYIYICMYNILF